MEVTDAENVIRVGETIKHVIAGCSPLSESTYLGKHKQLAKIIHQQTAIKCKKLDTNTPPYCRHKSETVLESAGTILYSDWSIRTDKTVDFNSPDTVPIDRQNKTAPVVDIAVPLPHYLARTEVEKITK